MNKKYSYEEFKSVLSGMIKEKFDNEINIEIHNIIKNNSLEGQNCHNPYLLIQYIYYTLSQQYPLFQYLANTLHNISDQFNNG